LTCADSPQKAPQFFNVTVHINGWKLEWCLAVAPRMLHMCDKTDVYPYIVLA